MIDKIVITLSESGFVDVNIGDVHFIHTSDIKEVLFNVNAAIKKLAHFPQPMYNGDKPTPITYEDFKNKYAKKKP